MCAPWANTDSWWRFARSDVILHVFGIECRKPTRFPVFYHNFSITSPKKISRKIFAMLSKTQHIFIFEHYLHSHYWTKMSDTFTFNRTELMPICQNNPWNFYANFSKTRLVSIGLWPPQSPDLTPLIFLKFS